MEKPLAGNKKLFSEATKTNKTNSWKIKDIDYQSFINWRVSLVSNVSP